MEFNYRTQAYLKEMEAVLTSSKYMVMLIDFHNMKAFVNKRDYYKKRNGKSCYVDHHFGKWIPFKKEDISYGMQNYTTYDSSVHGLEEIKGRKSIKYLSKETQEKIVKDYLKLTNPHSTGG